MDGWIVIPNWDKFQHYKDRDPAWVKDYVAQLHNPDYLALTFAQRGLLHDLRLLYAASHGQTPYVPSALSSALNGRTTNAQLERLNDAGLIEVVASRPLALTRSREGLLRNPKEAASTTATENGRASSPEEEDPPRDPEALTKIREMSERIGRRL